MNWLFSKVFYNKPIQKNLQPAPDGKVKNLTSRPAISKKLLMALSISVTNAQEMV